MFKRIISVLLVLTLSFSMVCVSFAEQSREEKILESLSLNEKIGQMIMPAFRYWGSNKITEINTSIANAIKDFGLGGVILFAENTQGTAQTARLIADMQTSAMASNSKIPLLISIDQEGGYIYRLGTGTSMPGNMALGATGDADNARKVGEIIGSELKALGINVDFAPDMDVNNNPNNPVIGVRSFSDDPNIVAKFGTKFIEGLDSKNIISSLKHFPGHGDTSVDSHAGLPCIKKSLSEIEKLELIPFKAGIDAGADMIMTAHIQYPKIEKATFNSIETGENIYLPATLSKTILTDVLRGKMGFDGVICTDSMQMDSICKNFGSLDAAKLAINAGADILLMPVNIIDDAGIVILKEYIGGIANMVKTGEISEKTIDESVLRILKLKSERGILDLNVNKEAKVRESLLVVGSKVNHDIEWGITEKAITLLKNESALPIKLTGTERAVVFSSYANEVTEVEYAASRLLSWGEISKNAVIDTFAYTKMTELSDEQKDAILNAKSVVVTIESALGWELEFVTKLINFAHENNKKITVISLQLPYDLTSYEKADALIAVYNSKGMNEIPTKFNGETKAYGPNLAVAITAVFGAIEPTGQLPVSIPGLAKRGDGLNGYMPFKDVSKNDYYVEAVRWAIENGVTSGVTKTSFAPNASCTRAEAVTFLWRVAGCPISDYETKFEDVTNSQYYAEAVRWAAENNITLGTSENAFSPNEICTRGQIITFIWRTCASPLATKETNFIDVHPFDYYSEAVNWAAEKKVANGTSENTFSPNNNCTRAQIVSFLYRVK